MHPLEGHNLSGGYGQAIVIRELDFAVGRGEWLSLVGPNGSGKSTLLKLLSTALPAVGGNVQLEGSNIQTLAGEVLARKIAFVPQRAVVPVGLSVYELVSLGRNPHQPWWQWRSTSDDRRAVEEALERTGLTAMSDRPVESLSGGEQQRAFVALALAQRTEILLLDEPTTHLDLRYQLELLELLQAINRQQQVTIVAVLHELNLAARYSDRLALLHQGRIRAIGSPEQVLTPGLVAEVFGIEVSVIQTAVGPQILPLQPCR